MMPRDRTPLPPGWRGGDWEQDGGEETWDEALRRAAFHEAGHAAAMLSAGIIPRAVVIAWGGAGMVQVDGGVEDLLSIEDRVACRLAGMAAELRIGNSTPWVAGRNDAVAVHTLLRPIRNRDWQRDLAWRRVGSLIGDYRVWRAVEMIAGHLLRRGVLEGPIWHAVAFEAAGIIHGRWRCWRFGAWPGARAAGIRRGWVPHGLPNPESGVVPPAGPIFRALARRAPFLTALGRAVEITAGVLCIGAIVLALGASALVVLGLI